MKRKTKSLNMKERKYPRLLLENMITEQQVDDILKKQRKMVEIRLLVSVVEENSGETWGSLGILIVCISKSYKLGI